MEALGAEAEGVAGGVSGEPNLARHPVGAVLSKAQRRRNCSHYFVHLLIVNPSTGKKTHNVRDAEFALCWAMQERMQILPRQLDLQSARTEE